MWDPGAGCPIGGLANPTWQPLPLYLGVVSSGVL
jgi:hypothetical protein